MGKVDIWVLREGRIFRERDMGYGISGQPDIYNLYFIFSFKNVN